MESERKQDVLIKDVYTIMGRGLIVVIDFNEQFLEFEKGKNVEIFIGEEFVSKATISEIEHVRGAIGIWSQRGLLLQGGNLQDVCKGMLIKVVDDEETLKASNEKVRVLRILEYIGDRVWVEYQLNSGGVPATGQKSFSKDGSSGIIKSAVIDQFPEILNPNT